MTITDKFWENKNLADLSSQEWEALCDRCGICCLYKIEDEDSGKIYLTNVACRFLDEMTCTCKLYENRKKAMPTCIKLTPENIVDLEWLPDTCAYRLILEGKALPEWHHLISGDPNSVHSAGISVRGKVVAEISINMDNLEDYVVEDLIESQQ